MASKGNVALLTGGARIGQVVAQSLATLGCDLALVHRGSRQAAEAPAKAAISAGVQAITIVPMRPIKIRSASVREQYPKQSPLRLFLTSTP
jgi:NAD(P)-dependent dehydrogenase (short-subunit alcohol dehydrogenase family)